MLVISEEDIKHALGIFSGRIEHPSQREKAENVVFHVLMKRARIFETEEAKNAFLATKKATPR